jgi:hypothetical protein
MKSSLGSATPFFPNSFSRFFSRVVGLGKIAPVLLFWFFLFSPLTAEAGLPRAAVSIPADQNLAAGLKAAEQCDVPNKLIVLPPLAFNFAGDQSPASLFDEQAQALQSVPEGSEVWLHVVVAAGALAGNETEKQITERVDAFIKSIPLSAAAVHGLTVEIREPLAAPDLFAFGLVRMALTAKGSNSGLRLALVFQPGFVRQHGEIVKRLATYSDLLGTTYYEGWREDAAWIAEHALNKPLILKLDAAASAATSSLLTATLAASGTSVDIVWSEPRDAKAAAAVCTVNSLTARSITSNMFPTDSAASPFSVAVEGVGNDQHRWFGAGPSDVVIVARVDATPGHSKTVRLQGIKPGPFEIKWYDPATGAQLPAREATKTDKGFAQTCDCTSEYALISIHKQSEADQTLYNTVEVKGGVDLKIEEIIARWQQNREAQKQRLANYLASSFMSLHFESTNLGPGFDVSMQLEQFFTRDGQMEVAQKEFYVNGVKFGKNHEFPLPQIEPEKVLSQPLELKLNERYDYKLLGTEQINGAMCYVIGVEPRARDKSRDKWPDEALYSGKIWIDGTTFREVKQYLSQRGAKSNVLVNTETQIFELVSDPNGHQFNLLRSISAQQLLNAAGRDFVVQRKVQFSNYRINSPEFSGALADEHTSDDPMFRDTDQGLRTLQKKGGERVLVDKSVKRIESLIAGAMYGGTFNFPIPFLGISIADFDFHHTGAQLSTFFAGPILISDLSKQYQPKFRLALDLALNGLPGENRIYSNNTELLQGEVWTWEQTTGLRASWQPSTHLSVTASTYFAYDNFLRTSSASEQYELPRNGLNVLPGLEIKYNRKGYVFDAHGTRGERINWRPFGCSSLALPPAGCGPSSSTQIPSPLLVQRPQNAFTLYDADLNKDYYIGKFTKGGWDMSYWGGNQLDRFSRYFPSFLSSPRMHGIPPGTDSFDAIAMANVHYGFHLLDFMKIDGMYAYARARNQEESLQFRKFDGLEVNFNTPGPLGTLVQGTVSYALDGNIARYNSRWAAYILIFKPLH